MAKKPEPADAGTITTAQAAKLLMVTETWIAKLHKEDYIPKVGRGKWNLVAVVQGYIKFLKADERRSSKSAGAHRIQTIRGDRMEMELQKERRELVPRADAQLVLDTVAGLLKSKLMAVPAKFTRDPQDRARLEGIIVDAINQIAQEIEDKGEALRTGDLDG